METMEAKNKAFLVENESAIDRLRLSNEKAIGELRTDVEKNINSITMRMIGVVSLGVAVLAVFITILQFFT